MPITKHQALAYHDGARPGKIEVSTTKPCRTQRDLSLAYTPGVAYPCLEIQKNPHDVFKYSARGNLVAVVTNGSAVLGLGDIGALASKPVMEGKAGTLGTFLIRCPGRSWQIHTDSSLHRAQPRLGTAG